MNGVDNSKLSSVAAASLDGDAERALVGAVLASGRAAVDEAVEAGVRPDDFANPRLALVWEAAAKMADAEQHIDLLTVVESLMVAGKLNDVGGSAPLAMLESAAASTAGIASHARMVMEGASYRRVAEASQILHRAAVERDMPAIELMAEAQDVFLHLGERSIGQAEIVDRAASVRRVLESAGKRAPGAVPTGFYGLDEFFRGGLRPGNLHLVAGRPGMAKTAFALGIAGNVADAGIPVGFLSLEVPADDLIEREIASVARAAPSSWGRRDEAARVAAAAAHVEARPMHVIDRAGISVAEVCAQGRRMKSRHGIGLFVVDHLGKVKPSDRYAGDKNNEIGEISEALRTLANNLQIPVLALSQLNRKVEDRPNKRPIMSDLRDSGSLEQDAYSIMFPFRPEYYLKDRTPEPLRGLCEVELAKNRGGPIGTINLTFEAATSRFSERNHDVE